MTINLDTLRKIAEAATPGPWTEFHENGTPGEYEAFNCPPATGAMLVNYAPMEQRAKDSRYIATFDPPTVLALITELETYRSRLDAMRRQRDGYRNQLRKTEQQIQRVREIAKADLKCPCCSGYEEILRALDGDTRRLADQGLGDNLARTTKNGENNA